MIEFNVREIMRALDIATAQILREDALAAATAVIVGTPVGDPELWVSDAPPGYVGGTARRNWNVSIGSTSEQVVEEVDADGTPTINEARAVISRYGERQASRGVPIHIQNAVPYIGRLNDGYSAQAPAGFVEEAVIAATTDDGDRREI